MSVHELVITAGHPNFFHGLFCHFDNITDYIHAKVYICRIFLVVSLSNFSYNTLTIDILEFAELELSIIFNIRLLIFDPLNNSFG